MVGMLRSLVILLLLGAAPQDGLRLQEESDAFGGRRTALTFNERPAFLLLPKGDAPAAPRGWVWYAPTFKDLYPNGRHAFLIERALKAGMGVAGIDVGESYGSPEGTRLFEGFHDAIVAKFKLSPKAVLLPQSRGGLMLYNWATLHPDKVSRIAGIYTVCDMRSWPGLDKACGAYKLTAEQLAKELPRHNPIELLTPLAKAKVPILHIHGDKDAAVPLDKNSAELARRYKALGGSMELVVVPGKGHEEVDEFFTSERFATFLTTGK